MNWRVLLLLAVTIVLGCASPYRRLNVDGGTAHSAVKTVKPQLESYERIVAVRQLDETDDADAAKAESFGIPGNSILVTTGWASGSGRVFLLEPDGDGWRIVRVLYVTG